MDGDLTIPANLIRFIPFDIQKACLPYIIKLCYMVRITCFFQRHKTFIIVRLDEAVKQIVIVRVRYLPEAVNVFVDAEEAEVACRLEKQNQRVGRLFLFSQMILAMLIFNSWGENVHLSPLVNLAIFMCIERIKICS